MAFPKILLGGVEYSVDFGSLTLADRIGERSTCSFVAWDLDGTLPDVVEGTPVAVYDPAGTLAFDGYVTVPNKLRPNPDDPLVRWQIDATDFHYLADRRLVADAWSGVTAATVVNDIITNVLSEEGITAGTIDTGPTLSEVVIAYSSGSRAMDAICKSTNHTWRIDTAKQLHYLPATDGTPTGTLGADDVRTAPVLRAQSPDYRNKQFIRGAQAYTDPQTESFKGDGEASTFVVGYPIGRVPTVTVNSVSKTVGIRGVDTGKDWYWSKGSNELTQDTSATKLGTGDTLAVTYDGLYDIVAIANDNAEQSRVKGVEGGGTGQVESVQNVANVYGQTAALEIASGYLDTYSRTGRRLDVVTASAAYTPGEWVTVQLPEIGLVSEVFLVVSVQVRDTARTEWEDTVELIQGADAGSWQRRLALGLEAPTGLSIRDNISESETLLVSEQILEAWTWSEADIETVWECPVPSTTTYPSSTMYPC